LRIPIRRIARAARCRFHQRFCERFSRAFFVRMSFSSYILVTYKKSAQKTRAKTLVKSTPGVNFINILSVRFSYKSLLSSFYLLRVLLWTNFCTKNLRVQCWWNRHQGRNSQNFLRQICKIFITFRCLYKATIHRK